MPVVHLMKDEDGWWVARLRWDSDVVITARKKSVQAVLKQIANDIVEEQFVDVVAGEVPAA